MALPCPLTPQRSSGVVWLAGYTDGTLQEKRKDKKSTHQFVSLPRHGLVAQRICDAFGKENLSTELAAHDGSRRGCKITVRLLAICLLSDNGCEHFCSPLEKFSSEGTELHEYFSHAQDAYEVCVESSVPLGSPLLLTSKYALKAGCGGATDKIDIKWPLFFTVLPDEVWSAINLVDNTKIEDLSRSWGLQGELL